MNWAVVLMTAGIAGGVMVAWHRGSRGLAFGLGFAGVLPGAALVQQVPIWMWVPLLVLAAGWGWHRWARTSATVSRWGARARRKSGVASTFDVVRTGGAIAMRRKAATVRPSLATTSRWARVRQLLTLPAAEVAVLLCRTGLLWVWASVEDVVCIFGGPRTGKSQWLAGRIIDAPGAVLVTSTRTDLLDITSPLRERRGPLFVFNPAGLGERESTITFDPLYGCTNPVTATERAADLLAAGIRGGNSGDREFWENQGRRVLAALLHAAALGEYSMHDVLGWVSDPDSAQHDVTSMLRRSSEAAFEADITQFITTNPRTRTSITSTIMPALGWLTHEPARAAATPVAEGGVAFDVGQLLESRATVYLLGAEETHTAPLVSALTGHIAREARRIAALRPGGRLDPPLGLYLDEAALICPVPLDRWTADMGGRGLTIVAAFQSRAQLLDRYGEAKAEVILNNTAAVMVFGGTRSRDDLNYWVTLGGERDEPVTTTNQHGKISSRTVRKVPVLAPAQIANLPARTVVTFRREMSPVIGRVEMAYRRGDVFALNNPHALSVRARVAFLGVVTQPHIWDVASWLVPAVARCRSWIAAQIAALRAGETTVTRDSSAGRDSESTAAVAALPGAVVEARAGHDTQVPVAHTNLTLGPWPGTEAGADAGVWRRPSSRPTNGTSNGTSNGAGDAESGRWN